MNFFLSRSAQLTIAGCALLLFFLVVAYPPHYFFLNDDFIHIPLAGGGSLFNRSFIRPVSDITLYLDHLLWQKNAAGYHLTNVLLHLLNTVCLFVLASKLFQRFSPVQGFDGRPWLAAFIFLVNGCQTESVFWIIGRGGSLAGLFGMLSLICYLNKDKKRWWLWLSFACFIIGMFAYEAVLALPLIVTIFYLAEKRTGGSRAGGYAVIGFWVICVLYFVYRLSGGALLNTYEQGALQQFDLLRLFYNFNTLVARSLVPPGIPEFFLPVYILLLLLLLAVAGRFIKKLPGGDFITLMFLCVLVAVIPFTTLGADTHDSESGRFVYFSSIFGCILLVQLVAAISRGYIRKVVGALLVIVHAWFFFNTAKDYRMAGEVVKQSLACLRGATVNAQLVDVPTQYHGALIFRSGLPEALQWYNDQKISVRIASSKEIYHAQCLSCEEGSINESAIILQPGEMLYYWTDSSIVRINP